MEEERHRYEPRGFLGRTKGIALAYVALHLSKALDRVAILQELATDLAISNSDDDDCVRLLREAAVQNSGDLEFAAEEVLDFVGPESRASDRAHRLLVAAWSGQPVTPSPLGDEVFSRIEDLYSTSVELAYPTLVALQPRLEELNQQFAPRSSPRMPRTPFGANCGLSWLR